MGTISDSAKPGLVTKCFREVSLPLGPKDEERGAVTMFQLQAEKANGDDA